MFLLVVIVSAAVVDGTPVISMLLSVTSLFQLTMPNGTMNLEGSEVFIDPADVPVQPPFTVSVKFFHDPRFTLLPSIVTVVAEESAAFPFVA